MIRILTAALLIALAMPLWALDFSNGSFDTDNRSWFFTAVTTVDGAPVDLSVTTDQLISFNNTRNFVWDTAYFQANLRVPTRGPTLAS